MKRSAKVELPNFFVTVLYIIYVLFFILQLVYCRMRSVNWRREKVYYWRILKKLNLLYFFSSINIFFSRLIYKKKYSIWMSYYNQGFQRKWILLARNCKPCKLRRIARNTVQFSTIPRNRIVIGKPNHNSQTSSRISLGLVLKF